MTAPPCLAPLLKAGFVEPDIKVGDTVGHRLRCRHGVEVYVLRVHRLDAQPDPRDSIICAWLDGRTNRVRVSRMQRVELVLLEPRSFGDALRQWISARRAKQRGRP